VSFSRLVSLSVGLLIASVSWLIGLSVGPQVATALETAFGHRTAASEEHVDVLMEGFAFRWDTCECRHSSLDRTRIWIWI